MRTYWWFVAIVPAFGLIVLLFGPGVMKAMGLMAVLWPISLPARAIFGTSKTGKLLEKGACASLADGVLYLHGAEGAGFKLSLSTVRRIERRRGFFVLVLARGAFVALPEGALSPEFASEVEREVLANSDTKSGSLL
ncbi:hypothetical protein EON82_07210 [bacterium]|nr:MAG: hypothetical protein EON82_07210 [bacterium]